jgi:transposase InsO family protein
VSSSVSPRTAQERSLIVAVEQFDQYRDGQGESVPGRSTQAAAPQPEFAYAQAWTSNQQRIDALPGWVVGYNTERAHSALGGRPPISRLAV